jgi:hypothetical protein
VTLVAEVRRPIDSDTGEYKDILKLQAGREGALDDSKTPRIGVAWFYEDVGIIVNLAIEAYREAALYYRSMREVVMQRQAAESQAHLEKTLNFGTLKDVWNKGRE